MFYQPNGPVLSSHFSPGCEGKSHVFLQLSIDQGLFFQTLLIPFETFSLILKCLPIFFPTKMFFLALTDIFVGFEGTPGVYIKLLIL